MVESLRDCCGRCALVWTRLPCFPPYDKQKKRLVFMLDLDNQVCLPWRTTARGVLKRRKKVFLNGTFARRPRVAVGGWRLVVGGGWWLAVGGPLGRSLRAGLNKKNLVPKGPPLQRPRQTLSRCQWATRRA